jgi:hypothetical protein
MRECGGARRIEPQMPCAQAQPYYRSRSKRIRDRIARVTTPKAVAVSSPAWQKPAAGTGR